MWVLDPNDVETSTACDTNDTIPPVLRLYTLFLLMFQTLFRLSDTALNVLLSFFALFFQTVSRSFNFIPDTFLSNLPTNIRAARHLANRKNHNFTQYICCPSCHSLYPRSNCIIHLPNGQTESKKCTFQRFPFHPLKHFREPCGTLLIKSVKSPPGNQILYPRLIYCYKSHRFIERNDETFWF